MSLLDELNHLQWREFEHLCLVLFERYYIAPDANFYGANNYGQNGIDIRLTTTKGGVAARVVIQCKARRSLDWSDFKDDLKRALEAFARDTVSEGREFTFIVATTAEIEDTDKFEAKKKKLVVQMGLGDVADRINFQVYTGTRLRTMVDGDSGLRKLFRPPARPADHVSNQELISLGRRLTRHLERAELASADRALTAYLQEEKPTSAFEFDWVPTLMLDQIADLAIGAGDFERARKVLNVALGTDPLDARYLLDYMRARRVLHAAPSNTLPRSHPFAQRAVVGAPEDDVEIMAPQLLAALGDTDRQLVLALWVVSYARERDLAEQGLARALGLLAQAWPKSVSRLVKDESYRLSKEGYLELTPAAREKFRLPAPSEHLAALALTVGYTYIRRVHEARHGFDSVRRVEEAHDGWPAAVEGISLDNATGYFTDLHPLCRRALRTNLSSLLAEGSAREFLRDRTDRMVSTMAPRLEHTTYAATPEFLLRDCEDHLVGRRVLELARANPLGNGVTILLSHLGLERLVQVQLGERLGANALHMFDQSSAMAQAISDVLRSLVRFEPAGIDRFDGPRPPFASRPCYADYAAPEHVNTLGSSIELARSRNLPFMGGTAFEWNLSKTELPPADRHLLYWRPGTLPAWA